MDKPIPKEVNLSGIVYKVQFSGDMVVFTEKNPVAYNPSRMMFTKGNAECWRYEKQIGAGFCSDDMVSHIIKAHEFCVKWFGPDFTPLERVEPEAPEPVKFFTIDQLMIISQLGGQFCYPQSEMTAKEPPGDFVCEKCGCKKAYYYSSGHLINAIRCWNCKVIRLEKA